MIHTKLLRHLAYVPWLLAAGLVMVKLTATPVAALELTATPNVIREDAGQTEIALEFTLDNALTADTQVLFAIVDSPSGDSDFDYDTEVATRDVDYRAQVQSLVIPRGAIKGMTTLIITPNDDSEESLAKVFTVTASVGGTSASTGIKITDNETPSSEIWLEVSPNEVYEGAGATEVTVTGTLDGRAFDANTTVSLIIDDTIEDAAIRDLDYQIAFSRLTILAGEVSGSTTISVIALEGGDKKIGLTAVAREVDVEASTVTITLKAGPPPPEVVSPDNNANASFVLSASPSTVSEEMEEATVTVTATLDSGALSSDVTVNLSIDPASTAEEEEDYELDIEDALVIRAGSTSGSTEVVLEVEDDGEPEGSETIILNGSTDGGSTVSSVQITLTDQSGQVVPSDPTKLVFTAVIDPQTYTIGTAITPLKLPTATGGTAPLTYFISTLPAGLSFNPATRTISGTPTQATTAAVNIFYTVVDSDNASAALNFTITVNEPVVPPPSTDAELTVTPSSIREDAGATQIELTVSLKEAKDAAETVTFTFVAPNQGVMATRDVDYVASLVGSPVIIPAGATVGKATLTLTPTNNTEEDSLRALGVHAAFSSGATLVQDITIVDDDTASTAITLSVSPQTISEESGATTVTVTATWDGKALSENKAVTVTFDLGSAATRDEDYTVESFSPWIEIAAGSTTGSMQFTLRPIPDKETEGNETIKLTGKINDGLMGDEVEITLTDSVTPNTSDETASTAITLSASPSTVSEEIEDATVTVTAMLNGGALSSDVTVNLSIDSASTAEEDEDYELDIDDLLVIRAGSTSGSTEVFLEVEDDGESEGRETIILNGSAGGGLTVGSVEITLTDQATTPTEPGDSALAFVAKVEAQTYTAGTAIDPLVLPEAVGGTSPLTYAVSSLPAGLSFDSATRTISGTPSAATDGAFPVVYQVTDADGQVVALTFSITVNKKLTIDLSDLFGSGKVVPTDALDGATIREFVVGQRVDGLVLPAAFSLAANFPNPFNPATTIQYALPTAADVELTVYNVVGQVVRTLVAEHQSAGRYTVEWDATDDRGHSVSAGLYLYRLQAGGEFAEVKKMLLLK